ncbi:MAG: DUF1349 domain-containing protein, partial [Bacteroidetes bacterium]|nr:DUF1349 domain-containing protein [Bacteroidota bacterium]
MKIAKAISVLLLFCIYNTFIASAIEVPPNAEAINVTDYGANGNDTIDDTKAIQQAIDDNWGFYGGHPNNFRFLYIPDGTYIISDQIYWQRWLVFQGESESGTIIKLKDSAEGFMDPASPKAVLRCHRDLNTSFSNYIQDITVNTGSGNTGAIGVSYGQHNMGAMRNVTITSETGSSIGLDLSETEFGPGLVKDVTIDNFETGIMTPGNVSHATLEHITVENCDLALNCNFPMSIRNLEVIDCEKGVTNTNTLSQLVLIDATFTGGSGSYSAIENTKSMYLRNITSDGFQSVLEDNGAVIAGNTIDEKLSGGNIGEAWPSPDEHLKLPVEDPVEFTEDPANWAFVDPSAGDDTENIQDAIDSGAETIYLSFTGDYTISSPIYIRGSVKRILGFNTAIKGDPSDFDNGEMPMIVFQNTVPVTVDFLRLSNWPQTPSILIDTDQQVFLKSTRTVNVRNTSMAEGGKLFIEDCFVNIFLDNPQNTWVRHLNQENNPYESADLSRIYNINRGGNLWVLGHKTESIATHVLTTEAGKTEILGGFYRDHFPNDTIPYFKTNESSISATYYNYSYDCCHNRSLNAIETVGGETMEYRPGMGTKAITLYSGFDTTVVLPPAPSDLVADSAGLYQVDLQWTNNVTGNPGIIIERKIEDGEFTKIETVYDTTRYSDTGLEPLTKYTYRVKTFNRAGFSGYSNLDSTTTPMPDNPPENPDNLVISETSSNFILTSWNDNSDTEDSVFVERRYTDSVTYSVVGSLGRNDTSYRDYGLLPSTSYTYRVRAWNLAGYSSYSNEITAETDMPITGWNAIDINSSGGSSSQNEGVMTIVAEGSDIWSGNDEFRFVYLKKKNNYIEIYARVLSLENTNEWAKAGVMIRETLNANSKHAFMSLTPEHGTSFQRRLGTNSNSDDTTPEDGITAPYWLRLVKNGNIYTGFNSPDGQTWNEVGSVEISMEDSLHVGLALTSHENGVYCTAEFDNINISATGNPIPETPDGLTATAVTANSIELSWNDNSDNEDGFIIQRTIGVRPYYDTIDTVPANITSYTDTSGLIATGTYTYRIRAFNQSGNSPWSELEEIQTPEALPVAPEQLSADSVSSNHVEMKWKDNSENEDGFIIQRKEGDNSFSTIDTLDADMTSYSDTGLAASQDYSYRVMAYNISGNS